MKRFGTAAVKKRTKASVDYSKGGHDHCGVCVHFQPPDACERVEGKIRSDYWCKLFRRKHG